MTSQRLYLDVEESSIGQGGFFSLVPPTPEQQLANERNYNAAALGVPKLRNRRSVSSDLSTSSDRWQTERSTSPSEFSVAETCTDSIDPSTLQLPTGKASKASKKKASHARKQHPTHVPRPRNAFILYRKYVVDSQLIPPSVEIKHQNISVVVAKMWAEALPEEKERFQEAARIEKEEHLAKYPGYRYQPVYRRTNVIRRRVKKDAAEEEKCSSMAELLIQGKVGTELEKEILEKTASANVESGGSDRGSTPGSRRGSIAPSCELSKGALRALRAQARQQSQQAASDWGDTSGWRDVPKKTPRRSNTVAHSHSRNASEHSLFGPSDGLSGINRAPAYAYPDQRPSLAQHRYHSMDSVGMAPLGMLPQQQQQQQTWSMPMPQAEPVWDPAYASPEPVFTSDTNMAFQDLPSMSIPDAQQMPTFDPVDNAYHQPDTQYLDVALSEYYTFDQALPFSPTGVVAPGDLVAESFQAGLPPLSQPEEMPFDALMFGDDFMRDYSEAVVHSEDMAYSWA